MPSGSCRYWQHFISLYAGNTKQTQLPVPSKSCRVYLLNEWTQDDWKALWVRVSQLPTLLPSRGFWEQVAVKSNPERKHLLLRKHKQGGQDQHEGKGVCPRYPSAGGSFSLLFRGSAKMVTIYPCFLWGRLMPQLSLSLCPTSLIPLLAMLGITWGALKAADASRIVDF